MTKITSGSEKQIKWASDIKSEIKINAACDACIAKGAGEEQVEMVREWLLDCQDAKFFIDNRADFNVHSANYSDVCFDNATHLLSAAAVAAGFVK